MTSLEACTVVESAREEEEGAATRRAGSRSWEGERRIAAQKDAEMEAIV